ncbi:PREDICTED: upstream activation factor subunit UAF30 [Theobroma cacao]|uniref:Upstream activation factor subunit UAF30 n=1 Tax=Theobroma cacao TaxID=3641 RepID=A0AB32VCR0_THECC|nr:PREDICTED: upstream activation factor subunit UAF30 [Theobroma cacao]
MMAISRVLGTGRGLIAVAKASSTSFASSSASNTSGAGLMRMMPVSPQLGEFLGASESSRTEAVKKIWGYIKLHKLQNPANKREILCDEKLKRIFAGKDSVGMFEITKLLSPHFVKSH